MDVIGILGESLDLGPIRPPSEAFSLLIRVTRNCPWNRCTFCKTYKGQKFELRTVDEVKQDIRAAKLIYDRINEIARRSGNGGNLREAAAQICNTATDPAYHNVALWVYAGARSAFLQDANTLIVPNKDLVEIIRFLKETFPGIERITSYARSKTAAKKTTEELRELREVGLSRLHIGLESGYDPLLQYIQKGVTVADHIAGGKKIKQSGISLSEYVILGLGGKKWWREHALETARVLNEINPDFIRLRTLTVTERMPLWQEVEEGNLIRLTDEEIVAEEKLFIENLSCEANLVSDHVTNLLQEIEGKLPEDKEKMLSVIRRFQDFPSEEKLNFKIGRRAGIYATLDELDDHRKHETVAQIVNRLHENGTDTDEEVVYSLMKRFL
ncbi:radical SAM protein [Chloroflexota bacterium]